MAAYHDDRTSMDLSTTGIEVKTAVDSRRDELSRLSPEEFSREFDTTRKQYQEAYEGCFRREANQISAPVTTDELDAIWTDFRLCEAELLRRFKVGVAEMKEASSKL